MAALPLPALLLVFAVVSARAQVTLTCDRPEVVSGRTCLFTAAHADGRDRAWTWTVLDGGGAFTKVRSGACNRFRAPRVEAPGVVRVQVWDRDPPSEASCVYELAVRPAPVVLARVPPEGAPPSYDPFQVASRGACRFLASRRSETAGAPETWHWTVQEPDGGAFTRSGPGPRQVYVAPTVLEKRTFHLWVTDPATGDADVHPLTVLPPPMDPGRAVALGTGLVGSFLHAGLQVPRVTCLTDFAPGVECGLPGSLEPLANAYVEGPEAGPLDGCWLVGDARGLCVVSPQHRVTRLPLRGQLWPGGEPLEPGAFPGVACVAVAARPPGPGPGPRLAVALRQHHPAAVDIVAVAICSLEPDGTVRPLAGRCRWHHRGWWRSCHQGPGADVDFQQVSGLALTRDGDLFVAATPFRLSGGITRITPDGQVAPFAGEFLDCGREPAPVDGVGLAARFKALGSLALDPATNELYVAEDQAIRRVAPDGTVTTVLGAGPAWPPPRFASAVLASLRWPLGLACHGGRLFLAEHRPSTVRVYEPGTGRLMALTAAPCGGDLPREGPLAPFDPGLLPEECGTVARPRGLGVGGGRIQVFGAGYLAHLDLPDGPLRMVSDLPR